MYFWKGRITRPFFCLMDLTRRSSALVAPCAFIVILGLTWLAYHPGLNGGFLFDDYANLPLLGAFGPVDNWTTFWHYLTSGFADPTGRPLALLSFLLDARNWPADPHPFKVTNLELHLFNGALLCWLLLKLGRALGKLGPQVAFAALLGSALWLLHPLFVSTTLYIVQREAMLPATFVLLGLIGYVSSREMAARGRLLGVWLAALSIGTFTVLGVLSKANGALLPLLAWCVDALILAPARPITDPRTQRYFKWMRAVVLIAPSLLLFSYLIAQAYLGFMHGPSANRTWTLGERLLTEPRILVEYLRLLWLPQPYTTGLFNDSIQVSRGLLSPPTTLFSILLIAALLTGAWKLRRAYPALALAIIFYFAGQLLESTTIQLELYYEHRNYLPAMLMFWPLALWLCQPAAQKRPEVKKNNMRYLRAALVIMLPLGLAGLTWMRADLWGNVREQALLWALKNPDSPRAQAYAAQIELARGHARFAETLLERGLGRKPHELQMTLNLLGAKCALGNLTTADIEAAKTALRDAPDTGRLGFDWFNRGLGIAQSGNCPGLNLGTLQALLGAAAENDRVNQIPGRVQDRLFLQGRIALMRKDGPQALGFFNAALAADPRPGAALAQAATLASAGYPKLAEEHLDYLQRVWKPPTGPGWSMPSLHRWLMWKSGYWQREIAHLRGVLSQETRHTDKSDAPPPDRAVQGAQPSSR